KIAEKEPRTSYRAIGPLPDRVRHHPRRYSRGRTRLRAAGRAFQIVRVAGWTGMEIGELGCYRLADDHRARRPQPGDDCRIRARPAARENRRATLGRKIRGVDDVLYRDGN